MTMKEKENLQLGGMNAGSNQMVQRCVIITRDENGYGLTVSGDNPVFVQSVKEDGAAARAGVRQGDRIIKVNGTLVTGANHMEVVKMISSGTYVALTLLGRPPSTTTLNSNSNLPTPGQITTVINAGGSSTVAHPPTVRHSLAQMMHMQSTESMTSSTSNKVGESSPISVKRSMTSVGEVKNRDFITGPQPVNPNKCRSQEEKQAEWRRKRIQIICQMLEEEKKHVEELLSELKRNASDKTQQLIDQAQKRIKNLESQLSDFKTSQGGDQSGATLQNASVTTKHTGKSTSSSVDTHADAVGGMTNKLSKQNENSLANSHFPSGLHYVAPAQVDVVPMEESDSDTEAVVPLETEGPFINFAELKNRPAHLAVFLHYLLSNCDPASLLFYLITDLYCYGSSKEMRKWAYEIHSSFLVPTAPLRVSAIDMTVVKEIDAVLYSVNENEQDDVMKKVFVRPRQRALDEINELLADFRNKRTLGLGNVFGESLLQNLSHGDVNRERKIVDTLLMQHFESFFAGTSDFDQLQDRQQALAIALATFLRHMGVKPSNSYHEKLLDKCPLFVAKEKKGFTLLAKPSKKAVQIKGHHFLLTPVFVTTYCYQCQDMIWGVNPQGYFCSSCDVVVHKCCAGSLEDTCYGSGQRKRSSFDVKHRYPPPQKLIHRGNSSDSVIGVMPSGSSQPLIVPGAIIISEEPEDRSGVDDSEDMDKTTDLPNSPMGKDNWASKSVSADSGYGGDVEKTTFINVGRSQSMKTREEHRVSKRNGDNGRRTKSDVDTDDKSIALAMGQESQTPQDMSVSSSSSSVSRASLPESPTTSADILLRTSIESSTTLTTITQIVDVNLDVSDSDLEADSEIPRLEDVLDWETVRHLKPKEKKRQEVINELFHTQRTHVRNLKVLRRVFYEPLLSSGILQPDIVKLLFSNIEEILDLHVKLNCAMKAMMKQNKLIGDIGELMLPFLDGSSGDQFRHAVATFCQHQQHALETLKLRQKKDQKLAQFLQEAECSSVCRKLQLKDMLPMEMQRLTKYPLLLETVAKYTHEPSEELDKLKRCIECAKGILDAVNTAKRNSENLRRLDELQRRLDTKDFDRVNSHAMTKLYKSLDLRQHKLIHEGPLTWRMGKNKAVDLHAVLLEDLLVLLTRNSDGQRLSLKFHNTNVATKEDGKFTHCPLLKLSSLIAKNVATDKKGIFIVSTSTHGPQIYELVAQSTTEKKTWFKFITDQIEMCKQRDAPPNTNAPGLPTSSTNANHRLDDTLSAVGTVAAESSTVDLTQETKLNDSCVSSDTSLVEEDAAPIERIQITSQPRLINPCEVQVCQPTILEHAEPVLTPLERLKRKDELILRSLADKHKIMAQIFGLPQEDLSHIAEIVMENKGNKEAKELALAAIVQTNRILEAINEAMKVKREEETRQELQQNATACNVVTESETNLQLVTVEKPAVPCVTLTRIAAPLMKHLTGLLHSLQFMEEDLKRVRNELHHYKSLSNSGGQLASSTEGVSTANVSSSHACGSIENSSQNSVNQTTNIDDYLRPTVANVPKLSICSASSEETITESKMPTPSMKSPASPCSSTVLPSSSASLETSLSLSPSSFRSGLTSVSDRSSLSNDVLALSPDVQKPSDVVVVGRTTPRLTSAGSSFEQPLFESPSSDLKSPESGDEEKKREKRKQRRQRHTALSGIEDPRNSSASEDIQLTPNMRRQGSFSTSPVREEMGKR